MSQAVCLGNKHTAVSLSEGLHVGFDYTREQQAHQQTFAKEHQRVIEMVERYNRLQEICK